MLQRLYTLTALLFAGTGFSAHAQNTVLSEKVLYIQDHYRFGYLLTHPNQTPPFASLIQFSDRVDSSRLYFRYRLEEQNPYYGFTRIRHAELLGDSLLAVEGEGHWADYHRYDSMAALTHRYRIGETHLNGRHGAASCRFHTDEDGRRYIRVQQSQRLLLRSSDFDRLIVTNYNLWVQSEAEKKQVMASKRLAYSLPRSVASVVTTTATLAALLALEYYF